MPRGGADCGAAAAGATDGAAVRHGSGHSDGRHGHSPGRSDRQAAGRGEDGGDSLGDQRTPAEICMYRRGSRLRAGRRWRRLIRRPSKRGRHCGRFIWLGSRRICPRSALRAQRAGYFGRRAQAGGADRRGDSQPGGVAVGQFTSGRSRPTTNGQGPTTAAQIGIAPTSFSISTVSTMTMASQGQPSRKQPSGPLLMHFLQPMQRIGRPECGQRVGGLHPAPRTCSLRRGNTPRRPANRRSRCSIR